MGLGGPIRPIAPRASVCESAGEAMRRRILAVGAALVGLASACSASHHAAPPSSTTSSTAAGPNPDVVPSVITPAYVNAVFAALEHVNGNAVRAMVSSGALTPGVLADLRAIYNDPLYGQEVKIARESLAGGASNVIRPPGDVRVAVVRLISSTPTCIFVQTSDDYSRVLQSPGPPPGSGYWGLDRKVASNDPTGVNTTPWALFFNAVYLKPTSIPDQCVTS
jgi:hypothetical protein